MEKLVCLEKIVARILSRYIGNVSGRQGDSPIRGNVAKRQKGCRFRRKAVPYVNVAIIPTLNYSLAYLMGITLNFNYQSVKSQYT